jgi:hypothetical protein
VSWKPYTYLVVFTHPDTRARMYYYGSKYGADADPELLWKKYFTSSDRVHELRDWYGDHCFSYEVRRKFDDVEACKRWEERVLKRMRVVEREEWLNQNDRFGPPLLVGEKNGFYGRQHTQEIRDLNGTKARQRNASPAYRLKNRRSSPSTAERAQSSERLKTLHREGRVPKPDFRGENNPMFGREHAVESRELMRQRKVGVYDGRNNPMFGREHRAESRAAMSRGKRGRPWVHRDGQIKLVTVESLDGYISQGWKRGRGPTQKSG